MANKIITQLADGLGRSSIVGTGLIVSLSAEGVEHQDNLDRGTAAKPRQAWVPGTGKAGCPLAVVARQRYRCRR